MCVLVYVCVYVYERKTKMCKNLQQMLKTTDEDAKKEACVCFLSVHATIDHIKYSREEKPTVNCHIYCIWSHKDPVKIA